MGASRGPARKQPVAWPVCPTPIAVPPPARGRDPLTAARVSAAAVASLGTRHSRVGGSRPVCAGWYSGGLERPRRWARRSAGRGALEWPGPPRMARPRGIVCVGVAGPVGTGPATDLPGHSRAQPCVDRGPSSVNRGSRDAAQRGAPSSRQGARVASCPHARGLESCFTVYLKIIPQPVVHGGCSEQHSFSFPV